MLKLPPQNLEAEQSVLGALMLDKNAVINTADILIPEDFYKPAHGKIYEAIIKLYEKREPIDILSISEKLKNDGSLKEIGGAAYLSQLVESVPTAAHVEHYARIVKEKKMLRDLIKTSAEITETAVEPSGDVETLLDSIEQKIFSISQRSFYHKFIKLKDELQGAFERIEKLHSGDGGLRGIPTGFPEIDNTLSGLQKSDLIIIGARPSLGKTSLALDIARNAALQSKMPVGIFSLEMSREQVVDRLIAATAQIPLWELRTGRLQKDEDFELIQHSLNHLSQAPIFIDDTPSPTILQMRSMARRLQTEHGLSLIIVDYLQLIQPRMHTENIVQQVTEFSRGLKSMARELNVPVLAVSQLSREVDKREIKRPRLSDLRESGCLTGDTLIMRADTGELLTMEELAKRSIQTPVPVCSLGKDLKLTIKPMTKVFSSGRKMIFELRTQSGRSIKASANHPFRTLNGWKRLDELKQKNTVALPRSLITEMPINLLADNELILLAHLTGDGCVLPRQPIHYTNGDFENILTVKKAAEELFDIQGRIIKQKNWWHVYLPSPYRLARGKHHPITKWFKMLKINLCHSWEKKLPPAIFSCSNKKIALFLQHLWSTDGNISWRKLPGRLPTAAIYYATTSKQLAHQIQHLLLRLKILNHLSKVNQGQYRPIYHIRIQDSQNQLHFLRIVGCIGKRAKIIPELIAALEKITPNPNTDIIPQIAWNLFVEPAKVAAGLSWRQVSTGLMTAYCGNTLFESGIGRKRMQRLADVCQNEQLNNLASSDVYWDKIVSITPLGEEKVYDATVADTHNFVANDIIVHNSIEQDADVVLFIYRKDRDKLNPTSEEENTAEIIIAKHRNGPTGTVKLKFDADKASFLSIDKYH